MIIFDDFDKCNLEGMLNYTSGVGSTRNYIIYEGNSVDSGFAEFSFSGISNTAYVYVGVESVGVPTTSMADYVTGFNESDILIDAGLFAEIINTDLWGTETQAIRVTSNGETDFREFSFYIPTDITMPEEKGFVWDSKSMSAYSTTQKSYFVLLPNGDNQIFYAKDEESMLKYGKQIHTLSNLDIMTTAVEKNVALQNKLAELKDPKARCFIDIPFDYGQPLELETVQVRLSYQNQGQLRSFKEGGHFKAWADEGTYRYKNFYIVGISHSKDGQHTRLRLMEKVD